MHEYGQLVCPQVDVRWQELLPVTHDEASLLFATDIWSHVAYCDAFRFIAETGAAQVHLAVLNRNRDLAEYRAKINHGLPKQSPNSILELVMTELSPNLKVVLAGVAQTEGALMAMQLRLGVMPRLWRFSTELSPQPIEEGVRAKFLVNAQMRAEFAQFLNHSICRHFPSIYLEGYQDLVTVALSENVLRKPLKAIFTNTLLSRSEQFKVWCATFVTQHQTKLFSGQYGGGYLVNRYVGWSEEYELSTVDKFLCWGSGPNIGKISATCAQTISEYFKLNPVGNLLVVLGPVTRNSDIYVMLGVQSNGSYFQVLDQFVNALSDEILMHTLVRPKRASPMRKPARVSADQIAEIFSKQVTIDNGGVSPHRRLSNARLAGLACNETTIPTNVMAGFPTIALWDSKYVRLMKQAEAVYKKMSEARVLFHPPTLAAEYIAEIWSDVNAWFNSKLVQEARNNS